MKMAVASGSTPPATSTFWGWIKVTNRTVDKGIKLLYINKKACETEKTIL